MIGQFELGRQAFMLHIHICMIVMGERRREWTGFEERHQHCIEQLKNTVEIANKWLPISSTPLCQRNVSSSSSSFINVTLEKVLNRSFAFLEQ